MYSKNILHGFFIFIFFYDRLKTLLVDFTLPSLCGFLIISLFFNEIKENIRD
jgi:hypothetical protein